jgi:hypothetical protein
VTTTSQFLAKVKERLAKATAGPWGLIELGRKIIVRADTPRRQSDYIAELNWSVHDAGEWFREDAEFIANSPIDVERLVEMVEVALRLAYLIDSEFADPTQGPSETLGKIDGHREEFLAQLDRIAGGGGT